MSLVRRLQRLVRAQWGSLQGDPVGTQEPTGSPGADRDRRASSASRGSDAEVPAEVARAYRALEVPVGSDRETVKKGYRRVMKKYHQDRFENDEEKRPVAGEVSKRLNVAYDRVLEYLDGVPS